MSSTTYFTSRQRTTFTRPALSARAAVHNPNQLFRALTTLGSRVSDLENRAGTGSISLKSSSASPISSPPPAASFAVSTQPGVFIVQIKNPETGSPETWIAFTPKKTSGTTGKGLKLPLLDVLRQSIAGTPHGLQTLLVTGYGKPFSSSNSFGNWFKERGAEAELPLFCTAHGLRKAGAVRSAENGATAKQMMAIFGWDSIRMAEHYIKMAEQKKLAGAGMHTLSHKS